MNFKRALWVSILLYLSIFVMFGIIMYIPYFESPTTNQSYIFLYITSVILTLVFAKWFFKALKPTWKRGFQFGLTIVGVSLVLDGLSALGAWAAGQSLDVFVELYTDWRFYLGVGLILAAATYAGGEFDGTRSKDA
jgi:hypothetical protein